MCVTFAAAGKDAARRFAPVRVVLTACSGQSFRSRESSGGRYWTRTSDFHRVRMAL